MSTKGAPPAVREVRTVALHRVVVALSSLALLPGTGVSVVAETPCEQLLQPGVAVAWRVTTDVPREYCLDLDEGDFALLAATTRGLTLTAEVRLPAGEILKGARFLDALDGRLELALVAESAGVYRLRLEPTLHGVGAHSLEVRLLQRRPSVPSDRVRVEAGRLLAQGWALQVEGSGESLRRAAEVIADSVPMWRSAGSAVWEGRSLFHLGWVQYLLGRSQEARESLGQALALHRQAGDSAWEGLTLSALGQLHIKSGAPQEGIDALEQALAIHRRSGSRALEANDLVTLGDAYRGVGEGDRAEGCYTLALRVFRELGDRASESVVLNNLGVRAWEGRDGEVALRFYQQALAIQRELGLKRFEAESLHNIGRVYADRGDYERALDTFRRSAVLDTDTGDRRGLANALNRAGFCALKLGRAQEAVDTLHRAVEVAQGVGEPLVEAGGHVNLARAYRDLGLVEEAREEVERTLRLVDEERADLRDPGRRATFMAKWHGFYEICIDILVALDARFPHRGLLEAAFAVSERARARSLFELLAEAHGEGGRLPNSALRQREDAAARRVSSVQTRLLEARRQDGAAADLSRLEAELAEAEDERTRLEDEARRLDPRSASLRLPRPASLAQVRERLAPGAALLEYSFGARTGHLFVVTKDALRAYPLPGPQEVRREVGELLEGTGRPGRTGWRRYVASARRLYEQLVAPAEALLGDRDSLVIAADDALYHLPFEVLLTAPPDGSAHEGGQPYLLRRWAVSYVPSGSVLAALHLGSRRPAGGSVERPPPILAAFGDPSFGNAAEVPPASSDGLPALVRSVFADSDQWRFRRLAFSKREVLDVARYYPSDRVAMFLGDSATEEAVKHDPAVASARCLHFATHALVSDSRPAHSALVLRLDGNSAEDGLLQVFEVYRLELDAELVVLSACETASGKAVAGEGLLGLARAFLYAGARRVVASHWAVADRSTAELMAKLHKRLARGVPPALALRLAKLEMVEEGRFAHPYFWAPFVLVGAPEPVVSPR